MKKTLSMLLCIAMIPIIMMGCMKKTDEVPISQALNDETTTTSSTDSITEEVTLKFMTSAKIAESKQYESIINLVTEKNPKIKIELLVIPGETADFDKKAMITLMAGDEADLIYINTLTANKFSAGNMLKPLDDYASEQGYDLDKTYGSSINKIDGRTYMLPAFRDVHITIYNKDLFDKAGIPYPDNKTFTWEKYIEYAKAITDENEGIYGSYMLEWDTYFTFSAKQKGIPAYKEDGTSNFDDPAWAESMKFFADLGNVYRVQPDIVTFKTKKMQWDGFVSGKYGMFVVGNWATILLSEMDSYPREWKAGIAIMPMAETDKNASLSIVGGYSICSTTKHEREAFEAVKIMAENEWTLPGKLPARIDLSDEEMTKVAESLVESLDFDNITIEDVKATILSPDITLVPEKVLGPGMTTINSLVEQVGELYASGQRTLEEAMAELKTKSDKAIVESTEQ